MQGEPAERMTLKASSLEFLAFKKLPQFQKIKKLRNPIQVNNRGISSSQILISNFDPSRRIGNSRPQAVRFNGRYFRNVYGKVLAGPLNVLRNRGSYTRGHFI